MPMRSDLDEEEEEGLQERGYDELEDDVDDEDDMDDFIVDNEEDAEQGPGGRKKKRRRGKGGISSEALQVRSRREAKWHQTLVVGRETRSTKPVKGLK